MRSLYRLPIFPTQLEPLAARSLSVLFILQELLNSFEQKTGALDKLCFYSEILLKTSKVEDRPLQMALEELQNERLPEKLRAYFTALRPCLFEARADENVILALIEKRERFNQHLGERAIEKLLLEMFPMGMEELRAVLNEGFSRRGFSSFFAEQEPLLAELESCLSPLLTS